MITSKELNAEVTEKTNEAQVNSTDPYPNIFEINMLRVLDAILDKQNFLLKQAGVKKNK